MGHTFLVPVQKLMGQAGSGRVNLTQGGGAENLGPVVYAWPWVYTRVVELVPVDSNTPLHIFEPPPPNIDKYNNN